MSIKTRFLTVNIVEVAGVGTNEAGSIFVIFKSGATHHVKYNDLEECAKDFSVLNEAMERPQGPLKHADGMTRI